MTEVADYAVVIPVYNEEVKLRSVLSRCQSAGVQKLIVVDDGSTDGSVAVAQEFATSVITLGCTKGVGAALREGIFQTTSEAVPYCVIMAGNDKDEPNEIQRLLAPLRDGRADFVQGSRWLSGGSIGGDMPNYRKWATKLHPQLFSCAVGKRVTESTNGFRAFRCDLLEDKRINLEQRWLDGYELEPYLLFKTIKLGYRHTEIPCSKIYPAKTLGVTKMRPILDWWSILRPIFFLWTGWKK